MKAPFPYFSIIIPALNEEEYLPKLLSNLTKQKYKHFEVIVVDGNSEDNTCKKAKEFKDSLNLRIITSDRRGTSYQKNLGASKAKGDYLVFIDADCQVTPSYLGNMSKYVKKKKKLVLMPKVIPLERSVFDDQLFAISNYFVEYSQIIAKPFITIGSVVFQKDYFHFIGGFTSAKRGNKFFPEDHEIILRSRQSGVIAKYMKDVVVKFSLRRLKVEGRLTVMRKYLVANAELFLTGEHKSKSVEYEMGGQHYASLKDNDKYSKPRIDEYRKMFIDLQKTFVEKLKNGLIQDLIKED